RIEWIEAQDDYLSVYADGKKHLIRQRIGALEEELDPSQFVRIHRSYIVRLDRIKGMKPILNGDQLLVLADNTELPITRTYSKNAPSRLGHHPKGGKFLPPFAHPPEPISPPFPPRPPSFSPPPPASPFPPAAKPLRLKAKPARFPQ